MTLTSDITPGETIRLVKATVSDAAGDECTVVTRRIPAPQGVPVHECTPRTCAECHDVLLRLALAAVTRPDAGTVTIHRDWIGVAHDLGARRGRRGGRR